MEAFDYVAPRSLPEVFSHLGNGQRTLLLAGGTDVIVQLREGRKHCGQLIDLKHVPELMGFGFSPDGTLEIGAATPLAEIYENPEVRRRLPGLVDATSLIGSVQIQSRASLGGNLCNASPAADSTPALMALGARVVVASADSRREIPVEDLMAGPGKNSLHEGEILLQVRIPQQPAHSGTRYIRFIPRNEMDIAVVGVGARITLSGDGDRVENIRLALGAVGPTAILVDTSNLAGKAPNDETFELAGELAAAAARPIDDMRGGVAQRRQLASVLTVRALQGALQRAQEAR